MKSNFHAGLRENSRREESNNSGNGKEEEKEALRGWKKKGNCFIAIEERVDFYCPNSKNLLKVFMFLLGGN